MAPWKSVTFLFYVLSSKIQKDWRDKKKSTYSDFKDKVDIKVGSN